ncbi:amino acid ABC transporter substrate-binding protein [Aliikangiella marina]|uniref:Amino acid ABC transporter substrate-binding protein n=1 Tax=Aliikangiella marina TaxID=1712262 RepID=A0A545T9M8_9GAMM|nr:transporter substrate-binding domain-containing protein [Aliikangiella marina]TQV73916.1 amino acid ABC transporter substrate-binding protein [Aliikangiella marina]
MSIQAMTFKPYLHCLLLVLIHQASAASELKFVTENRAPYQYYTENEQLTGYCAEVMAKLLAQAKLDTEIKVIPWPRAYKLALEKPNYLIFSISRSALRENKFVWGGKLMRERIYAWRMKGQNKPQSLSYEDLKGARFAISRSTNAAQTAKDEGFSHLYLVDNSNQSLKMLQAGQVDFIFATDEAPKRAESLGLSSQDLEKFVELDAFSNDLYFAFSKGTDKRHINQIMTAYTALQSTGILVDLKNKWQIE